MVTGLALGKLHFQGCIYTVLLLDPWRPQAQLPILVWLWDLQEALLGAAEPSLDVSLWSTHTCKQVGAGWASPVAQRTPTDGRRMVSSPMAGIRAGPNVITTVARLPWSAATGHVAEDSSGCHHRGDTGDPTSRRLPACRVSHHQHAVVHLLFYKPWLGH